MPPKKKKGTSNGSRERPANYFRALEVSNVRCFGSEAQMLDLSNGDGQPARWTVILGNNGTGKTTLLECLSASCRVEATPPWQEYSDCVPRMFALASAEALALCRVGTGLAATLRTVVSEALTLNANAATRTRGDDWNNELKIVSGRRQARSLDAAAMPLCYFYGAGRRMGTTSLTKQNPSDQTRSTFDEGESLLNAEEWLLKLDYSASKKSEIQERQRARMEHITKLLIDILPDVEGIRFNAPTKEKEQPSVEFETPYGWVPLSRLGYGYRTLLAWMVDFASRMMDRYSRHKDPLAQPAVVLVDEIDLHLHPSWQRAIMNYLTERFANTQFIVTAHSPLLVQAATDANLVVLRREGDHAVIDNSVEAVRGWRVDQVLTSDLFGLESARPPELDDALVERKRLLTKAKLTKTDEKKLAKLEKQIGSLPGGETAQDAKTMSLLKDALDVVGKRSGKKR